MFTEPFTSLSTFDKAATIALYLTIAILLCIVAALLATKKFLPTKLKDTQKMSLTFASGYAVGLSSILLFLKLDEYLSLDYVDLKVFIPVVIVLCVCVLLVFVGFCITIFKPEKTKTYSKIALISAALTLIAAFVFASVSNYSDSGNLGVSKEIALYVSSAVLVAIIAVIALVFGKQKAVDNTKSTVYAAMCIAMSFALSYIRFLQLPQDGSITFASLLPLMLYSYMFGIRKGVIAGIIYGFLQFIQSPWFIHPVQFLLDYPIAFAAIGLSGIFRERNMFSKILPLQFALGGILSVIIRYFSHVISGIFVFGSGDPENYGAVAWSFLYNSFAFADMAIVLVVGCAMLSSRQLVKLIEAQTPSSKTEGKNSMTKQKDESSTGVDGDVDILG